MTITPPYKQQPRRTSLPRNLTSGVVGTTAITALAAGKAFFYLRVINPSPTGNNGPSLAITYDGVTVPVINSVGIQLDPRFTDEHVDNIPTGAVQIIASAVNTPYCIEYC
jgi:hypothetical protein